MHSSRPCLHPQSHAATCTHMHTHGKHNPAIPAPAHPATPHQHTRPCPTVHHVSSNMANRPHTLLAAADCHTAAAGPPRQSSTRASVPHTRLGRVLSVLQHTQTNLRDPALHATTPHTHQQEGRATTLPAITPHTTPLPASSHTAAANCAEGRHHRPLTACQSAHISIFSCRGLPARAG